MKNAEKLDAKVVLIGDTKQLQAVEAGKMFSKLQENGALKTVRMSEALRQKEESYKDFTKDISAKKIDSALSKLETQGRLHEIGNRKERFDAIVQDYLSRSPYRDVTVVTARNQDRNDLNAALLPSL